MARKKQTASQALASYRNWNRYMTQGACSLLRLVAKRVGMEEQYKESIDLTENIILASIEEDWHRKREDVNGTAKVVGRIGERRAQKLIEKLRAHA